MRCSIWRRCSAGSPCGDPAATSRLTVRVWHAKRLAEPTLMGPTKDGRPGRHTCSPGRGPPNENHSEWSVDPRQPVAGRSDRVLQRLVLQVSRN
jgi:hypothetical protein